MSSVCGCVRVQIVRHTGLLQSANTSMLQAKLALRTPYVTPLNILQARPSLLADTIGSATVLPWPESD